MQPLRKREKGNGTRFVCYNSPSFSSPLPHYRAGSFSRQGTRTTRHKKTSTASAPVTAAQPLFHEHTAHQSGRTARRDLSGHRVFPLLHSPPFFFRSPQLTTAISSRARFNSAHVSFPSLMNYGSCGVTFLMQHKLGDLTDLPRSVQMAL